MKSIELFCASPSSTAICSSMEQYKMVRHGMKQIDRHTHYLGDGQKGRSQASCSTQLPFDPMPYYYHKARKSSAKQNELRRKSAAGITDLASPPSSSRYLLNDSPTFELLTDADVSVLVPCKPVRDKQLSTKELPVFMSSLAQSHESPVYRLSSTKRNHSQVQKFYSTHTRPGDHQVVQLRVSLHCKGCEGKVRKHLSKMEGVTSFSIDFVSKKVIVIGYVTPLGVLASISKVKSAQFWPSPTSSSSLSSSMSTHG